MDKNQSWYYCSFPNGKTEGIISIPKELEENSNSMCCTLYEVEGWLGEAMFEAVTLSKNVLEEDCVRGKCEIEDGVLYRHLEQGVSEFNPLKAFLKEWFLNVRKTPADINSADAETKIIYNFLDQRVTKGESCTTRMLRQFACECYRSIKGAEIVQVNIEDCIYKAWLGESTDDILDIILMLYKIPKKEKETIRDQFKLYMDNPAVFCSKLKGWVNSCVSRNERVDDLIITYHLYKINSLYDLFSATMQEIILARRCIKHCAHCEKLFVASKSDEIFCSCRCNEEEQILRKERKERVNRCKERHKDDYDYMWEKLYNIDGRNMTATLLEPWNEHIEDVLMGRYTEEMFSDWVAEQKEWVDGCV